MGDVKPAALEQLDPTSREEAVTAYLSHALDRLALAVQMTGPEAVAAIKAEIATAAEAPMAGSSVKPKRRWATLQTAVESHFDCSTDTIRRYIAEGLIQSDLLRQADEFVHLNGSSAATRSEVRISSAKHPGRKDLTHKHD